MFGSNKSSQYNSHSKMPYRLRTVYALYSFCIYGKPYLPCSTIWHAFQSLHAQQHALHTKHYHSTTFTILLCTQLTNTRHRWQNGTKAVLPNFCSCKHTALRGVWGHVPPGSFFKLDGQKTPLIGQQFLVRRILIVATCPHHKSLIPRVTYWTLASYIWKVSADMLL